MGTARGDLIHDVDERAASLGLRPGGRATDAVAAHRDLAWAYGDPAAEGRALERLAAWARRWSPSTRTDGPAGIALDVTGCTHLFGGETGLLADMDRRLAALDVTVRLAIAPNHGAAHALARHGTPRDGEAFVEAGGGDLADWLAPLPVEALRLSPDAVALLQRLGLKTVGPLAGLPRAALKRRFGTKTRRRDPRDDTWEDYLGRSVGASDDVVARLDEACGRVAVPFDPTREREPARLVRGLSEPLFQTDTVMACLQPLLRTLMERLERDGEGVRLLRAEGFRTDGGRATATVGLTRAGRSVPHLMRLLEERVDAWRAEFGFDALAVEAAVTEPLDPDQTDTEARERGPDTAALVDRLGARLGEAAVRRARLVESHLPERAEAWVVTGTAGWAAPEPARHGAGLRERQRDFDMEAWRGGAREDAHALAGLAGVQPERLLEPPEEIGVIHAMPDGPPARFVWRHVARTVTRLDGPERIAPEWWRERSHARARDYWRVETKEGERFLLFREGFEGDRVLAADAPARPRWFLQGLFG